MRKATVALLVVLMLCVGAAPAPAVGAQGSTPFKLIDGDRVAMVGGTFVEREGQFGYIETALTTRFPQASVTFRNLGYAGDTVTCNARNLCSGFAEFGPADQGFNRLKSMIAEIKPTVIFVGYGMTESFDGEAKLPAFSTNYEKLLDMLTAAAGGSPKLVLITPNSHEALGAPMPDPAPHNKDLKRYCDAIQQIARKRGCAFVDLFTPLEGQNPHLPLTINGIHLSSYGFLVAAASVEQALGLDAKPAQIEFNFAGGVPSATGGTLSDFKKIERGVSFTYQSATLASPLMLKAANLPKGNYLVSMAGSGGEKFSRDALEEGVVLTNQTNTKQVEDLRSIVVAKNADYFRYWRPENDTYILGYRKHEQGQNSAELPKFKQLVEEKEAEIAKLRVPQPVTYTLEKQ